jgi:serine/threonine protein kinase
VLSSAIQIVEFSELKLKEKIGEGAFGQTFKGKFRGVDVAVKRAFAVHELPVPGSFTDADIADFFFRELKMLMFVLSSLSTNSPTNTIKFEMSYSKLRHPNIVRYPNYVPFRPDLH